MKNLTIVSVLISVLSFSGCVPDHSEFDKLKWLEGRWERTQMEPGKVAFEEWDLTDSGLEGIGITFQEGDTFFIETLGIVKRDSSLYYVADVSHNERAVYFKITEMSETGFTCSNHKHDFPKIIEYNLKANELHVEIRDGKTKLPFSFVRSEK